jgi:uroporphyrinogen decarboxylase
MAGGLNVRERFLAVMNFEPVRPPKWEFGYWVGALRRWYREGLVEQAGIPAGWADGRHVYGGGGSWAPGRWVDQDVRRAMGMDEGMQRIAVNNYFCPAFQEQVLEEHENWLLVRDDMGMIIRRKKNLDSLPHFERGPVANRDDWEKLKADRLQPRLQGRLPANWSELVEGYQKRTYPLAIGGSQGFFGTPRSLFGQVQVLTAFYDCPDLMRDIVNDLADFWIALYDQVLDQVDADLALIWEDMAYKNGPLISPQFFIEFLSGAYKKLTGFFHERGVRVIHVDCDGNVWKLLPLFIESGVTGLYPFEVMAGMQVAEVRQAFPKLQILGGVDKTALAKGPEATEVVLEQTPWMLDKGGYIPYVDHMVPPDVSWENFCYYRKRLNEMIDD